MTPHEIAGEASQGHPAPAHPAFSPASWVLVVNIAVMGVVVGVVVWLLTQLNAKADAAEFRAVKEEQIRRTGVLEAVQSRLVDIAEDVAEIKADVRAVRDTVLRSPPRRGAHP